MAPKIGNILGTEGQSLGDFLQLSDTPTLRSKYYSMLEEGLSGASEPAALDQGNLLWQGLLPTLATAFLTKGKSLGFSGVPIAGVMEREQKRAEQNRSLDIETKLKGAGLIGDTLQQRDALAASTISREEDRAQRERDSIRDSEDKRYQANLSAETQKSNAAMMAEAAKGRDSDRDRNANFSQSNTIVDDYERDAKPYKEGARQLKQMITLAQTAKQNPENAKAAVGMLAGLSIQISQGGGRVSDKDIALVGGSSADATLNKWQNWIDGGARGTMPEMTPESILVASRALGKALSESYLELDKKSKKRTELMSDPTTSKKTNEYLDMGNPFKGMNFDSANGPVMYQTKSGPRTIEQLRSGVPGWTDDMITNYPVIK